MVRLRRPRDLSAGVRPVRHVGDLDGLPIELDVEALDYFLPSDVADLCRFIGRPRSVTVVGPDPRVVAQAVEALRALSHLRAVG